MLIRKTLFPVLALSLSLVTAARADDNPAAVKFPTSCEPQVQAAFDNAVALLHAYAFGDAGKAFQAVLQKDPKCAIAHWGIAAGLLGDPLAGPPPAKDILAAKAALENGHALNAKTPRERDWIGAQGAYLRDLDQTPAAARLDAYEAAMEQLAAKYPDDFEAKVFHALAIQAAAPRNDVNYASQLKSAAILERLYEQNPRHPGVSHYLILAYATPTLANKGLAAARRYAALMPGVPAALHAPSLIHSALGAWDDALAADTAALALQPELYSAADFAAYAALQLAQDDKARALVDKALVTATRAAQPLTAEDACALAALPARHALERMDWAAAATLTVAPGSWPQAESITRYARGLGLALTGNVAGARREIAALNALRATLQKSDQGYWADRTEEQVLTISAWVALAEGNRPEALKLMNAAADSEDVHIRDPLLVNRLYPMRELLAEMLMEMSQPKPSLQEFETALAAYPNRYRALWGATLTAAASGQRQKAFAYIDRFVAQTKNADTQRPEIARARAFVAKR